MDNTNLCVWRLFDRNETSDRRYLKYYFTLDPARLQNMELIVVGEDSGFVLDLTAQFYKSRTTEFTVNSLDYNTSNVYMIARKSKFPQAPVDKFELTFDLIFYEKYPLSSGAVFAIVFFIILFLMGGIVYGVFWLNREGFISIYIPKPLRKYCLKSMITQEQLDAMNAKRELEKVVDKTKSLAHRKSVKPGINGFKIDDSYFGEDGDVPP